MYLKKVSLHNFKCYEDLEVEFDKNLTVLVGTNGAGKTSILESAAIAVSSMFVKMDGLKGRGIDKMHARLKTYHVGSTKDVQPQYPVSVSASMQTMNKELKWKRALNSSSGNTTIVDAKDIIELGIQLQEDLRNGDTALILPVIAYYGTGRMWDYHREKQTDVFETNNRLNGYIDCVDGTANIKLMLNWFRKMTIQKYQNLELGAGEIPELTAVCSAMEVCYKKITKNKDIKIQYNMGTAELEAVFKDENGDWMRIPVNQLSDGYKSTISLVADIAYRMAVLNPQLLDNICKETDGIVLIDEVDLHLHPAWQENILSDLQEIFPRVQFIVTTHAPAVINTVEKQHIRILSNNCVTESPTETYGKDANGVLKAIMGANERPLSVKMKFNDFYDAMTMESYSRAETILRELEESLGENDPDLTACRMQLALAQI